MGSKGIRGFVIVLLALLMGVAARSQAAQMPQIPLYFEPNHGQWDAPGLRYVARAPGYEALFFDGEVELRVKGAAQQPLRLSLENAAAHSAPQAEAPRAGRSNYLRGRDPAAWITRVPLFGRLRYAQLRDGVDWTFYGDPARLEHDLVVAPGADPRALRLRVRGAEAVALTGEGDLLLKIGGRSLLQRRPVAYQHSGARRHSVEAHYRIEQRSADGVLIAFDLGDYDRSRTLVIDPVLELAYSGLIGGAGDDAAYGIAVDGNGSAYVVGETESPDFPGGPGSLEGSSAAFVLKLDPSGNGLVYVTYLDGDSLETLNAVAVDAQGHAYVAGTTGSDDLPIVNAFQPTPGSGLDGWVAKLSPGGDALIYSSYLGGSGPDFASAIQVRADGVAVVAGTADDDDFPADNTKNLGDDAFVTAISADGSSLVYSRFLGGSSSDQAYALALGPDGHAYVAGSTSSADFPIVGNGQAYAGADAFVARLDGQGELLWSRYLGGADGLERGYAIAVDADGAAYVAGSSDGNDFPLVNALQGDRPGEDGFVTKLSPDGATLVYSTYLAGDGIQSDEALAIAVDELGQAYVAGETENPNDFPVKDSLQASLGYADSFVAKLSADGSRLIYSTLLGGEDGGSTTSLSRSGGAGGDVESINAIALDSSGNAYVAGTTGAKDFPQPGGFGIPGEMHDAFVAKIVALDEPGEDDDPPPGGGDDGGDDDGGGGAWTGLALLVGLLALGMRFRQRRSCS